MRIRTESMIMTLVFGAILVAMVALVLITSQKVERTSAREKMAADIARGAGELSYLGNEYLIYREDQQLKRWQARFASFSALVASLNADKPEQLALVRSIQANQQRLREVFDSTVSTAGKGVADPALLQVSWSRMAVQSQGLISDASRLAQLLRQQMDGITEARTLLMYAMTAFLGLFLLITSMLTYRRVLKSIALLQAGTRVIGSGNLEFVIEEREKDEIGDLSHAFNRMTTDLKAVTASKADLEREMAERKRMEQALRESEQRYRTLFEKSLDAVMLTNPSGKGTILSANPAACRMFGRTEQEMIGLSRDDIFAPHEPGLANLLRERESIGNYTGEVTYRRADGTTFPGEVSSSFFTDSNGNLRSVAIVRDITERKRAEERREHLASYPRLNPGPVIEVGVSGEVTFSNPASQAILQNLGFDKGDLKMLLPPDLDAILRDWDKENQSTLEREVFLVDRVLDETIHLVPQFKVARIYARDITERKRAEEALLRAKDAWERTFASVPDLIAILDNQYQVLRVNEAMAGRLGVKAEEAVGLRCYEVVHGLSGPPDYCPHSRTIKDGRQHIDEVHEDRLGGDFVVSTTPLHDNKGQMIGTVHVAHDITKRKEAERALQKAHTELEIRVEERTAELSQAYEKLETEMAERSRIEEQLRQSQKMEAVGTLAGGIAHDFNNMLAAIIGNAELAMDDVPEEMTARHNLEQIFKAGMRARGLVRQILTFSRKTEQERKPTSLAPLVTETFNLLRASLPTIIEMRLNIDAPSDVVLADPVQIQQVLMNLCTNAGDAMRHAGGRLEVSLTNTIFTEDDPLPEAGMRPGAYVTLMVSDTGPGMHEDVKDRIFEPFFTTKERGQGTGMGLAVVYGIVKGHHGVITVLSEPGQGATFEVYLPRHTSGEKGTDEPASRPIPRGRERILFVDDEEMLVEMAEGMLGHLGYEVTGKTDSTDALQTFAKEPNAFDLVVTDHTMPQMTGAILAQKLKEIRPDIPVILCTGYSETISKEKAESMGIDGFVMKPLSRNELGEIVRRVLITTARG